MILKNIDLKDANIGIDSHIQMPKCILKQFVNEYNAFYYYDVNKSNKQIKKGHPKSLNTQKGYYSLSVERKLQNLVETPLGDKINYVNSDFDTPKDVPFDFRDVALTYLHSLIARAPRTYSVIEKQSILLKLFNNLSDREKNDFAVESVMAEANKKSPFEDYIVTMIVNKTDIPFILPIGGMYSYGDFVCSPLSPHRGIALVKQNTKLCNELMDGNVCKVLLIENELVLHQMNKFAINAEVVHNKQYIVSSKKELLEMYLKELYLID